MALETATWENCRNHFVLERALIDLRVPGTKDPEWEVFWAALRAGPFELHAFRDGESIPLPESAEWVFIERERASVMVTVRAGTVTANCHFFGGDLELDVYPPEINTEAAFASVLAIMRFVASAVGLAMFAMTEGGSLEEAFLRVTPDFKR